LTEGVLTVYHRLEPEEKPKICKKKKKSLASISTNPKEAENCKKFADFTCRLPLPRRALGSFHHTDIPQTRRRRTRCARRLTAEGGFESALRARLASATCSATRRLYRAPRPSPLPDATTASPTSLALLRSPETFCSDDPARPRGSRCGASTRSAASSRPCARG
jgi:hypothetical protein